MNFDFNTAQSAMKPTNTPGASGGFSDSLIDLDDFPSVSPAAKNKPPNASLLELNQALEAGASTKQSLVPATTRIFEDSANRASAPLTSAPSPQSEETPENSLISNDAESMSIEEEANGSSVLFDEEQLAAPKISLSDPKYTKRLHANKFSLIAPYCGLRTLISLAGVCKSARAVATNENIWKPLCTSVGFSAKSSNADFQTLVSPFNVVDEGFLSGSEGDGAYLTFVRAYNVLYSTINNPGDAVEGLNHLERAGVLGNALAFAQKTDENKVSAIESVIKQCKDELIADLQTTIKEEGRPISCLLFKAVEKWTQKTGNENLKREAVHLFLSKYSVELFPKDVFVNIASTALVSEDEDDFEGVKRQVSQQKLESAFGKVASSLLHTMSDVNDTASPIPAAWKSYTWSLALSKYMAATVLFIREVLEIAQTEISEEEYLHAVPKVNQASRVLSKNSVLLEFADKAEFDVATYVDLTIMRPIIEEFCDKQAEYFERYVKVKVRIWNDSVSQRENETEQHLWSNVPKRSDKKFFISSFKWAFMSSDEQADSDRSATTAHDTSRNSDYLNVSNAEPATEFEAQTALLLSKLRGMESLVSFELAIDTLEKCREALHRLKAVGKLNPETCEPLFCAYLRVVGNGHLRTSFEKAIKVLNEYDPKRYGRLLISVGDNEKSASSLARDHELTSGFQSHDREDNTGDSANAAKKANAVEPLAVFTEMMNVGDLVQQMVHVFFEEELVGNHIVRISDFTAPSVKAKRKFEQMLDDMLAEGLSRGIDVLMEQVEFTLLTEQLGSDYQPLPTQVVSGGPTAAATHVIDLVRSHLDLLRESTEKSLFDVFQQEVGLRLYASLSKHLKRQTVNLDGAINLISDVNAYYAFIATLRQKDLLLYYETLKQVSQLFLIETKYAKQIALTIGDSSRYNGLVTTEDLVEFVKRRQDWPFIKPKIEKVLYGIFECIIC